MSDKKNNKKRETKAGMLGKNYRPSDENDKANEAASTDKEKMPKTSKDKAEERDTERPVH